MYLKYNDVPYGVIAYDFDIKGYRLFTTDTEYKEHYEEHMREEMEEEDPEAWEDDSYRSCADCPPDECTGHCMSCYYRTVQEGNENGRN